MVLTEEERKERQREYARRYREKEKNKEKRREYGKEYREKNNDKLKEYFKEYFHKNREKQQENTRLNNWKRSGVIHSDFNDLHDYYINCPCCEICKKSFKNARDKCLDHCHETGKFRNVLCQDCNIYDRWIKKEKVIKWLEEMILKIKND